MDNSIESIWQNYNQEIGRYLLKLSADSDIASEIKSNVFEKLLLKYSTINDKSKVRSWLYTTAKNQYFDFKKRQKKQVSLEDADISEEQEEEVALDDLSQCTVHLISNLPEKYRLPIYLSDIKGKKQKDIATKLNLDYSALKSRVQRARKILKEKMQDCCEIKTNDRGQIIDYHNGGQSSKEFCKHCFT